MKAEIFGELARSRRQMILYSVRISASAIKGAKIGVRNELEIRHDADPEPPLNCFPHALTASDLENGLSLQSIARERLLQGAPRSGALLAEHERLRSQFGHSAVSAAEPAVGGDRMKGP